MTSVRQPRDEDIGSKCVGQEVTETFRTMPWRTSDSTQEECAIDRFGAEDHVDNTERRADVSSSMQLLERLHHR